MKILFYEVRHFRPNFHEFIGSPFLSPKVGRKKKMSKSVSGYYKTKKKKKKKWHGPLSHWRREGKILVVLPLKKTFFYVCLPLPCIHLTWWIRSLRFAMMIIIQSDQNLWLKTNKYKKSTYSVVNFI